MRHFRRDLSISWCGLQRCYHFRRRCRRSRWCPHVRRRRRHLLAVVIGTDVIIAPYATFFTHKKGQTWGSTWPYGLRPQPPSPFSSPSCSSSSSSSSSSLSSLFLVHLAAQRPFLRQCRRPRLPHRRLPLQTPLLLLDWHLLAAADGKEKKTLFWRGKKWLRSTFEINDEIRQFISKTVSYFLPLV